MASSLLWSFTK